MLSALAKRFALERLRASGYYRPGTGFTRGTVAGAGWQRNAQHHHRHECQGRRRQVDARSGPCRDALHLSRQENPRHRLPTRRPASATCCCPQRQLDALQDEGQTIVDYLIGAVLKETPEDWRRYVIAGVSDVDDARSIDLLPSDTNLTLFEREVSKGERETLLRRTIGTCLKEARKGYDYVLIDSAPGLSVLTEMLVARGRLLPVAHAARLHLHARPRLPAQVPPAQSRRWASPSSSAPSST